MFDYGETHVICHPLIRPQFYCFKRVEMNASSSILTSMSHNRKLLTYSWNLIKVKYVFASCIRTFQVRFVCGMHFILSNEKAIWKYHFPTRKTKTAFHVKKTPLRWNDLNQRAFYGCFSVFIVLMPTTTFHWMVSGNVGYKFRYWAFKNSSEKSNQFSVHWKREISFNGWHQDTKKVRTNVKYELNWEQDFKLIEFISGSRIFSHQNSLPYLYVIQIKM